VHLGVNGLRAKGVAASTPVGTNSRSEARGEQNKMQTDHYLLASPETVVWGYFDSAVSPVLRIRSGETVKVDTVPAGDGSELPQDRSRILSDHELVLERSERDMGPHILTGPIYVEGAKAGDVLQIEILDARIRSDWGYAAVQPLVGTLPEEFPDYETVIVDVSPDGQVCRLPWGAVIPLDPFFGVIGVAPPPAWGRQSSVVPRAFGGNMDNKALRPGSTLYLPVFNDGALLSVGDGHGVQGDGEVCVTALETSLTGTFRITVRSELGYMVPFAENKDHLISIGLDEDLDDAVKMAVREMVREVCRRTNLSRNQAYILCSLAGDLKVTQVVDICKGVHMMLPKAVL
jgi:acetamidase/formamidase